MSFKNHSKNDSIYLDITTQTQLPPSQAIDVDTTFLLSLFALLVASLKKVAAWFAVVYVPTSQTFSLIALSVIIPPFYETFKNNRSRLTILRNSFIDHGLSLYEMEGEDLSINEPSSIWYRFLFFGLQEITFIKDKGDSMTKFICPYEGETEHGYKSVEIIEDCCEVGENCLEQCEYSYESASEKAHKAVLLFSDMPHHEKSDYYR